MSTARLDPPLLPKDGHLLRLLVPVRVSNPTKQDERSLGDQQNKIENWLRERVDFPFELTVLEGRESGELLDRAEFQKLIDEVATGLYDGVVSEDLGRIVRRLQAHLFCEHCVDHDTRVIAINDNVDTSRSGWQDASIFSAWHHERSNRDTSDRIKRTHRSRFMQGGCLPRELFGYTKPLGAKHDGQMSKLASAEPIYKEWFRMLDEEKDVSFAEVGRWLRNQGVKFPTRVAGEYVDPDAKSVARYTFNTILKGVRERNRRKSKRVGSGKYVSVKAEPSELLQRNVSHLAFFDEAYYDRVVAKVRAGTARYRRSDDPMTDPCRHRPRKQSRFPGGVVVCEVCGRSYVWGGHGQTDHLMCNGAREHRCWNGATFDGSMAARRIAAATYRAIEGLARFDSRFLQAINDEAGRLEGDSLRRIEDARARAAAADRAVANLLKFVRGGDESLAVRDELKLVEKEHAQLSASLAALQREPTHAVQIPNLAELKRLGRECLANLDVASEEFARVMRRLAPVVRVFPVRLCDGGGVRMRARVTLDLSELITDGRTREVLRRPLQRVVLVNLFDLPQREAFRDRVVAGRSAGRSERAIATELGITVTAAQHAISLQRKMDEIGITDPYVRVLEPPNDCTKLRRHLNPDYAFEPLAPPNEI